MAGNDVTIQLRAPDGASNTFRQIGRESATMGKTMQRVGTSGERSLGKINTAALISGAFGVR
jgi:hypothetical protein